MGDQAAADLSTVFDDWGGSVIFTAPEGSVPASVTVPGIVDRISMATDLTTGEKVAAKRSSVTCLLAGLTTMPADGWRVDASDQAGAFVAYVDGDPMPDQSLGLVVIKLRQ
jgi:hypothetical protein